jgi:hypothetical protein
MEYISSCVIVEVAILNNLSLGRCSVTFPLVSKSAVDLPHAGAVLPYRLVTEPTGTELTHLPWFESPGG